uniref:NADH-ubiquinone oxidoreductase chain 4 n=1 Tax=Balclutha sp. EMHAU-2015-Zz052711 TaxID=2036851 RepID=A0A343K1A8_9HEMI|nr:NADH dehydrogenase subunit 4 [Balclutha sp. EMHAU-2015-Zz052711]
MMKIIIYLIMMTPANFNKKSLILNQMMYMMLFMILLLTNYNNFFSSVSYFLGMDIFSYNLMLLSLIIISLMVMTMYNSKKVSTYLLMNLCLAFFLLMIFSTLNFFYMYMSFEFVLVPLVIMILGWGYQPERLISGMYLFFYTLIVSLPLLMLILKLYKSCGSMFFDYLKFDSSFLIYHLIMMIVFMVKMPMYLMHFWLPKAHVQAPVAGSMILAGLMLKIGGYGLIRIMYMFEFMYMNYSYMWFALSIIGSIFIGMMCLIQEDIKCLIAYSSVSHMGMVIVGLLSMSKWGLMGAFMLMLAHGFCSSGMFYMANLFYLRTTSRSFFINKGIMIFMPSSSMFWFMLCAFNMSCPPSLNFISELMILSSMVSFWMMSTLFFMLMSFICACFSYYLFSYTQHGTFSSMYSFSTINMMEMLCLFMHLIPLIFYPLILNNLM